MTFYIRFLLIKNVFCDRIMDAKISVDAYFALTEVSFYNTFLRKQSPVVPLPGTVFFD